MPPSERHDVLSIPAPIRLKAAILANLEVAINGETSASMEEMASMTRNNSENSQDASKLMAEANRLVDGSNRSLGDMVVSRRGTAAVARPATTVSSAPRTRLVTFGRRQAPPRLSQQSAEEAIPLENTGTYGNF